MNTEPLVSIIIPIYNSESYLCRCIDSVLKQDYQNYELILADDGSTDRSGATCDEYAARDSRIQVLHQPNRGVSAARNLALDHASGVYVQFLDSDDWIAPEATRLLVRSMEMNQCDMVISDFYRVSGAHLAHKGDINETHVLSREEFSSNMVENPADFYYGVLWNKLFKRELIERYHIRMDVELSWCEDFLFNLEYIRHAHSFYALKAPIYYYVKRKGSLVSQCANLGSTLKMKINVFEYYNEFYKDLYDQADYRSIRLQIYKFFLSVAKDGTVLPLPGTLKLEKEKTKFHEKALTQRGLPMDVYRLRKLLEYQLRTVAKKHDLSSEEILFLYQLSFLNEFSDLKELSDFTGFSSQKTVSLLQKLTKKGLISKQSEKRRLLLTIQPGQEALLRDLKLVAQDFNSVRLGSFTPEEQEEFLRLEEKSQEAISGFLSRLS